MPSKPAPVAGKSLPQVIRPPASCRISAFRLIRRLGTAPPDPPKATPSLPHPPSTPKHLRSTNQSHLQWIISDERIWIISGKCSSPRLLTKRPGRSVPEHSGQAKTSVQASREARFASREVYSSRSTTFKTRGFWVALWEAWPSWDSRLVIVTPETVVKWQRQRGSLEQAHRGGPRRSVA